MNLLDLFFPRRCVSCGKIGKYFCPKCTEKIRFIDHQICPVCGKAAIGGATHPKCQTRYSLDGLTAFFHYDGPIRKAIKQLKYRFVSDLAKEFVDLILFSSFNNETMKPASPAGRQLNNAVLIPIPLHSSRLRFRGFNQAEILGDLIAKRLHISIKKDTLKRVKKTTAQVEMKDRKKRLSNMENVFVVNQSALRQILGQVIANDQLSILLFDDVFTTGATLRSAANVLKRVGIKKVWGIVMAHG